LGQDAIPDDAYGRGDFVDEMPVCSDELDRHEKARLTTRTNIQEDGTIVLLINDMVFEDLVVEGLGSGDKARHNEWGDRCLEIRGE
jgi:hypothetical protein